MESSGFFDATLVGETYDRVYYAAQFANYFACFVGNGVFAGQGQNLQVVATRPVSMTVNVMPGRAWINGFWYNNDDELNLEIDLSDAVNPRIDSIVLRHDVSARTITAEVVKGTPSSSPVAPSVVRNADYYELKLADIRVIAGAITISNSNITDTRPDETVCGWVTGLIDQVSTSDLYLQFQSALNEFIANESATFASWSAGERLNYENWISGQENDFESWAEGQETAFSTWFNTNTSSWQAQFDDWFANIQAILDEDVAGNLALAVNELNSRVDNLEQMVIRGNAFAPAATQDNELLQTYGGEVILLEWKL